MSESVAMGNFLTRLAGQARGAAPALTPRLPALFEPGSPALAPMAGETPATSRRLPPRVSQEPGGDSLLPDDGESAPVRGTPSPRRTQRVNPGTLPDAGTEARASVPASVATPATPRRRVRSATAAPVRIAASATVDGAPPTAHADAGAVTATTENPSPRAMVENMPTPDRSLARTMRTKPATATSSLAPAPAPPDRIRPSVAMDAQAWRARGDGGRAAEPVIRVSIGRIEVRAVAAPSTTTQPPERARPTRLDDYLQQRGRTR